MIENFALVVGGLVLIYLWLMSIKRILSARMEGPRRRSYLEDKLVKELREAIFGGERKEEASGDVEVDPLAGILTEIYDDLYDRVSEEEKERKREIKALKREIDELKGKIDELKER
jgi:hypothetical protein